MGNADVRNITRHGRQKSDPSLPALEQRGFEAVLWDWDGVLADSGCNFYDAYETVLRVGGLSRILVKFICGRASLPHGF